MAAVGARATSRSEDGERLVELELGHLRRLLLGMAREQHTFAALGLLMVDLMAGNSHGRELNGATATVLAAST